MNFINNKNIKIDSSGIYFIRNTVNNNFYIGSTGNFYKRFYQHSKLLESNKHFNKHMQNSYNLYGHDNFIFEIIESVINDSNILLKKEQKYLNLYWDKCKKCFNCNKKAKIKLNRIIKNKRKLTKQHKEKIRKAHLGKKLSEEHKEKIRENAKNNPNYGNKNKKVSNETKEKISNSRLGEKHWLYGKTHSEQTKKKMRKIYNVNLLSPSGEKYYIIENINEFVKIHNLSIAGLKFLIYGKRKSHKGWTNIR